MVDSGTATARAVEPTSLVTLFALAHVIFVAVRPSPTTLELIGFELVIFAALVGVEITSRSGNRRHGLLMLTGLYFALVGGTWLMLDWTTPGWAAVALAAVGAFTFYGLYRYRLVTLGLVEGGR